MGMHVMRVRRITRDTFRASRRYRLVAHDRVPRRLRSVVRRLVDDPDFFGLLLPRSPPEQDAKAVCRDTATLFGALRKPATLPRSIVEHLGKRADKAIAKLVLDGILELQRGADFVSVQWRSSICSPLRRSIPFTDVPASSLSRHWYRRGNSWAPVSRP